ncbi:MAG: hypothetical protein KAS32_09290 [Candidatus Peribacteraceae bacterium]|nr:hypothetical protein [Candidatus Peribacteraceae bacterium]
MDKKDYLKNKIQAINNTVLDARLKHITDKEAVKRIYGLMMGTHILHKDYDKTYIIISIKKVD